MTMSMRVALLVAGALQGQPPRLAVGASCGLANDIQRPRPGRLGGEVRPSRARRQLRRHVPRRQRRDSGQLRQVHRVRLAVRAPVLQAEALALRAGARVPLLRPAGEGRAVVCAVEQRRDGALAGAGDDSEGAGLADFGRSAIPRRRPDDDERVHAGDGDFHEGRDGEAALRRIRRRRSMATTSGSRSRSKCSAPSTCGI